MDDSTRPLLRFYSLTGSPRARPGAAAASWNLADAVSLALRTEI
jgi:hypothetical protein